ncbi:MAG: hypothetical protein ABW109_20760, partial [Candidatus Thiodiazotropha sp. 6PLUC4]
VWVGCNGVRVRLVCFFFPDYASLHPGYMSEVLVGCNGIWVRLACLFPGLRFASSRLHGLWSGWGVTECG